MGLTLGWSHLVVQFSFRFAGAGEWVPFSSVLSSLSSQSTFPMWKKEKMCACVVLAVVATQLYSLLF